MKKILCTLLALCLMCGCAFAEEAAYETLNNAQLGITLKYPTGWVSNPGTATICFLESLTTETVPGRMAVSVKPVSSTPSSEKMEDQLSSLSGEIAKMYTNFNVAEMTTNGKFMNTRAYALRYTADSDRGGVTGYVVITHISKKIYAFHYSCGSDMFEANSAQIQTLRDAVALTGK